MKDLKKRLLISSISALIIILLIVFSHVTFMSLILTMVISALSGIAVWEFSKLAQAKGLEPTTKLMIEVAVLTVFSIYISTLYPWYSFLPILILFIGLIAFFLSHFKSISHALANISLEFFSVLYIAVPLALMLGILYFSSPAHPHFDGRWWLFYLIFVTKITDIGGYFIGRLWGKRPLAPILSPNKTLEGSIAGLICAIAFSALFSLLGQALSDGGFTLTLFHSLWLGALLGIVGQIGDLGESLFKRDAAVKDSNSLPGLGGILDMVDSLLLTIPIVYFFIKAAL